MNSKEILEKISVTDFERAQRLPVLDPEKLAQFLETLYSSIIQLQELQMNRNQKDLDFLNRERPCVPGDDCNTRGRWRPRVEDKYFTVTSHGKVIFRKWDNYPADEGCYEMGNCFQTEEEAEEARDKIKALLLSL